MSEDPKPLFKFRLTDEIPSRPWLIGNPRNPNTVRQYVGDDYPAVLREMKANGSGILVVGSYIGKRATEKQFVQAFAAAGILIVFARELG